MVFAGGGRQTMCPLVTEVQTCALPVTSRVPTRCSKAAKAAVRNAAAPAMVAAAAILEEGRPMKARVHVSLKNGVLDPQGKAIGQALHSLGFAEVGEVRPGKLNELELTGALEIGRASWRERVCQYV